MELTPEVLRALAAGIQNLNDGDPSDRAVSDAVERAMLLEHGLIRWGQAWHPAAEATEGYTAEGVYVWTNFRGDWTDGKDNTHPSGTQLYFDEGATTPLRKIP